MLGHLVRPAVSQSQRGTAGAKVGAQHVRACTAECDRARQKHTTEHGRQTMWLSPCPKALPMGCLCCEVTGCE